MAEGVLAVFDQHDLLAGKTLHGLHKRGYHAVATAIQGVTCRALQEFGLQLVDVVLPAHLVIAQAPATIVAEIGLLEQLVYFLRPHLGFTLLRVALNRGTEIDLQPAGQLQPEIPLQHIGDTALTGLTVDAYHLLV